MTGVQNMDVTYTYEFDAKRFERSVKRALAFSFRGATVFSWCIVAAWLLLVFRQWLGGWPEDGRSFLFVMPIFFALMGYWRCVVVRAYVRQARQMMGGGVPATCHVTDSGYETVCGETVQKMPWRSVATHYHFLDDDAVYFTLKTNAPVVVLSDLREHGIARAEFETVLRRAGLMQVGASRVRRIQIFVSALVGVAIVAVHASFVHFAITSFRECIYCQQARIDLFDLIHGKDDPRRPLPLDNVRTKVVRLLSDVREPDERLYLFVPDEEYDKVGLYARYGNWSCEAFYPCGCACPQNRGYFDHIKQLHNPTVYLESEKSAWLVKVRPLAKDLYEKDDE